MSVRSFLPPRTSRPRNNIGTYVFTATRKTLLYIIIVIFAENASFRSLLFAISTKNAHFIQKLQHIRLLLLAHILHSRLAV